LRHSCNCARSQSLTAIASANVISGRFLSVDPVLETEKAIKEPQRWNRYAYVLNNPINHTDPTGKIVEVDASADVNRLKAMLTETMRRGCRIRGSRCSSAALRQLQRGCDERERSPQRRRAGAAKWCVGRAASPRGGSVPLVAMASMNDDEPCSTRRPRASARAAHVQPRRTDVGLMLASAARCRLR
jgi:hypothetical protein